jgi:hypothetical protein
METVYAPERLKPDPIKQCELPRIIMHSFPDELDEEYQNSLSFSRLTTYSQSANSPNFNVDLVLDFKAGHSFRA